MEAMEKNDQAAIGSLKGDLTSLRNVVKQLDCHMMSLAPSISLYTDF